MGGSIQANAEVPTGGGPAALAETTIPALPDPLRQIGGAALLDVVFDQAPPLWLADRDNRLLFANPAYRQVMGNAGLRDSVGAIARVFASGEPALHHETAKVGGDVRHFRVYMFPIPGNVRPPVAVGGLLHDATAEVNALARAHEDQQRFRDVIRSTSDWVWETDRHGRLTFISDRIIEALGMPAAMLRGITLAELGRFAVEPGSGIENGSQGAMATHQPFRNVAFAVAGADKKLRHFALSGVPVFNRDGDFAGYRGTASDISARMAAEVAVRGYQVKLEAALEHLHKNNIELDAALGEARSAAEAKSAFLATMSHELRTPLNAIIGFSELMTMAAFGKLDNTYDEYAGHILQSGRRLLEIIDNVLDLSRLESAKLPLDLQPIAISTMIDDGVAMVAARAAEKQVTLDRPENVDGVVLVDRARAVQALVNLLDNAVKFTAVGGRAGVVVEPAAENRVRLVVWDSGSGISAEDQVLLFDKFQQFHQGILTRRHGGVGIGLTIARRLMRAMAGDLELEATSPQGSRFAMTMPLAGTAA